MDYKLKDSGTREQFNTGSQRDAQAGKGAYYLLPFEGIDLLAKLFEKGAVKYEKRNWEKGQPISQYIGSALRHTFKWLGGWRDEDHLVAACWNLLCAVTTRERILQGRLPADLDDIPVLADQSLCNEKKPETTEAFKETVNTATRAYSVDNGDTAAGQRAILDTSRPMQTRDGVAAKWIGTSLRPQVPYPIHISIQESDGKILQSYTVNQYGERFDGNPSKDDVHNV